MGANHSSPNWEDWARGATWLHRRDARAKIAAVLATLIGISFAPALGSATVAIVAWLLVIATGVAGLPTLAVVARACAVLPFALAFALMSWISGDLPRAQMLVAKSLLSAWAVVLLLGTTPLAALMTGFERLGVPTLVAEVILMLVRYLTVLGDRASSMRRAAAARGAASSWRGSWTGLPWGRGTQRSAGAGMMAALFRDAMERATRIHQAMLARGYSGRFPALNATRWGWADWVLAAGAAVVMVGTRWL